MYSLDFLRRSREHLSHIALSKNYKRIYKTFRKRIKSFVLQILWCLILRSFCFLYAHMDVYRLRLLFFSLWLERDFYRLRRKRTSLFHLTIMNFYYSSFFFLVNSKTVYKHLIKERLRRKMKIIMGFFSDISI